MDYYLIVLCFILSRVLSEMAIKSKTLSATVTSFKASKIQKSISTDHQSLNEEGKNSILFWPPFREPFLNRSKFTYVNPSNESSKYFMGLLILIRLPLPLASLSYILQHQTQILKTVSHKSFLKRLTAWLRNKCAYCSWIRERIVLV